MKRTYIAPELVKVKLASAQMIATSYPKHDEEGSTQWSAKFWGLVDDDTEESDDYEFDVL